jgi:hypothetical protein
MGVWVALAESGEKNGALIAVGGSHNISESDFHKLKDLYILNVEVPTSSTPLFDTYNKELRDISKSQI